MGWASTYIEQLKEGKTVQMRPKGQSMAGKIESGQLCTVAPILSESHIQVGDIVLCKVHGFQYLHLVTAIRRTDGPQYQISNNRGNINGWVSAKQIYGKLIKVE